MGGSSNSSPPSDSPPGGGTFPTFLGQAYNPAWYSGGQSTSSGGGFSALPIQSLNIPGSSIGSPQQTPPVTIAQSNPILMDFLQRYGSQIFGQNVNNAPSVF